MTRFYIAIVLIGLFSCGFSQSYKINGTITGLENENIYLMKLMGEKRSIVDTAQTDNTGAFLFNLQEATEPGMYIVIKGPGKAVELVYNKENIQFIASGFDNDDGIQIISSVENLIYYNYMGIKGMNLYKLDVLKTFLNNYPPNDEFYSEAIKQYNSLKDELNNRVDQLIANNQLTLVSRYIAYDRPIIADPQLSIVEQNKYEKLHFFDNVDFNDTMLIRSTFLTSKVVGYLSLFQNDASSQEELEDFMLMGVDTVLNHASINQKVYEFLADFLIKGFESIGFEKGLLHIANISVLNQFCENTDRKLKLENKIELINKLALGKIAPDFSTEDIDGNKVVLSDITADKTILIFWASWCPHCDEIMPIIKSFYGDKSKLEVIAISIDESEEELRKRLNEFGYDWINIAELKGWNGDIIEEYGIAATPSVFILDKDKRIVGKPLGKSEVREFLE
jgi:thiol-disulfide isomerase/thioredoxin